MPVLQRPQGRQRTLGMRALCSARPQPLPASRSTCAVSDIEHRGARRLALGCMFMLFPLAFFYLLLLLANIARDAADQGLGFASADVPGGLGNSFVNTTSGLTAALQSHARHGQFVFVEDSEKSNYKPKATIDFYKSTQNAIFNTVVPDSREEVPSPLAEINVAFSNIQTTLQLPTPALNQHARRSSSLSRDGLLLRRRPAMADCRSRSDLSSRPAGVCAAQT